MKRLSTETRRELDVKARERFKDSYDEIMTTSDIESRKDIISSIYSPNFVQIGRIGKVCIFKYSFGSDLEIKLCVNLFCF